MIDPSLFTLPYDRELVVGLGESGHHVTLHGRRPDESDGEPGSIDLHTGFYRISDGPLMRSLPGRVRLAAKGLDHAVSMRGLLTRLRRDAPDVIHFQWLPLPLLDRMFLGALGRIAPLVLTVHDTMPFNGNPASRLQALGFPAALRRFQAVIVHTDQGRDRLRASGVPQDRLAVLPHGVIGATPEPNPDASARDDGITTFLLFGKMKPYKGIDLLIEAFARMPAGLRARSRLRVVGKPYMDLGPVRMLADRLAVADRLSIEPRFVADHEIPELFGPGVVAVFPYREIEASGVLSLAKAYARPVIASRLGSFAEMVQEGVHGHLIEAGDVDALARALAHLVTDPAFAARCGDAMGREALATPSWKDIGRQTASVYQSARAKWVAAPASPLVGRSHSWRAMQ